MLCTCLGTYSHGGCAQVPLGPGAALELRGSLLQLRGSAVGQTPLVDDRGNVLLFNGEIFGGLDVPRGANDGRCLLAALGRAATGAGVVAVLSALRGPWALVYWQAAARTLWLGRDAIGERGEGERGRRADWDCKSE